MYYLYCLKTKDTNKCYSNISYVVQQICLYMRDPRNSHFLALKLIIWYIQGTLSLGLHLSNVAYLDTRWSTSHYCVYFGDNLISKSAKCLSTFLF